MNLLVPFLPAGEHQHSQTLHRHIGTRLSSAGTPMANSVVLRLLGPRVLGIDAKYSHWFRHFHVVLSSKGMVVASSCIII